MDVFHTSAVDTGQIYLPAINGVLLFGVLLLVLIFQDSAALATAYGISVTGAMLVTTIMFLDFVRMQWKWPFAAALAVVLPLGGLELVFLSANLTKIHDGGYVPIMIAAIVVAIMWTLRKGAAILTEKNRRAHVPLKDFVNSIDRESEHAPNRVPGTAIFLTSTPESTPAALLHNLKHNHILHHNNIVLSVATESVPTVAEEDRATMEKLSPSFTVLKLRFGFMDTPKVTQALAKLRREGLKFDIMSTSFYLGRRKLVPDANSGMPVWQERLFIALAGAAADPSDYFRLPANRVVELGAHVTI